MKILCAKTLSTIQTGCAYFDLQVAFAQKCVSKMAPEITSGKHNLNPHGTCDVIIFSKGDDITMEILV